MNETKRSILEALTEGPVGGPALADALDVSRAAVWKQIDELRDAGFEIESGSDGYVLTAITEYNAAAVEYGLEAPFSVEYHDAIGSTNDRARELATDGLTDVAVLADEQTGGRGRLERPWSAPSGGVWTTLVCRPDIPPTRAPLYTLAAAVATTRAVREAGVDARIKWPNDIVVPVEDADIDRPYRKLAGILTEMEGETDRVSWIAVGIGVNANIDASTLPPEATSIRAEAGDVDRRVFVQRLLEELDTQRTALGEVVDAWRELALTIGMRVRVDRSDEEIVGTAVDVTETGSLVVQTDGEERIVSAGDCEHLRRA